MNDPATTATIWSAAQQAHAAGLNVMPAAEDGTKAPHPYVGPWGYLATQPQARDDLDRLFGTSPDECTRHGIILVAGRRLVILDFDDQEAWHTFNAAIAEAGLEQLWHRVRAGYHALTPRAGGGRLRDRPPADLDRAG